MALIKEIVVGSIEVLEDASLQVREDTVILEDDVEISRTFTRYVAVPGDDVSSKPQRVQDLANLLWTPEVIQSWKDKHPPVPVV